MSIGVEDCPWIGRVSTRFDNLEVEDRALDPNDGGRVRLPFRFSDRRLGFEYGDGSGFVAVKPMGVWTQDLDRLLTTNSTAASRERLTATSFVREFLN